MGTNTKVESIAFKNKVAQSMIYIVQNIRTCLILGLPWLGLVEMLPRVLMIVERILPVNITY